MKKQYSKSIGLSHGWNGLIVTVYRSWFDDKNKLHMSSKTYNPKKHDNIRLLSHVLENNPPHTVKTSVFMTLMIVIYHYRHDFKDHTTRMKEGK